MTKIGVIGVGTVGYPLYKTLQYYHEKVYVYDIAKRYNQWTKILDTDIVFICVPTDGGDRGRLDMRHVDSNLELLNDCSYKGIVVIKSTLKLGYIDSAIKKYNLNIVVFPEWLRAKYSFQDTITPEMVVIGSNSDKTTKDVLSICKWIKPQDVHEVKPEEAVMIKLAANALASTKISFANQIFLICKEYNIDERTVMNVLQYDPRCTPRYLNPGESYSGYCLPKDTQELEKAILDTYLLRGVRLINEIMKEKYK